MGITRLTVNGLIYAKDSFGGPRGMTPRVQVKCKKMFDIWRCMVIYWIRDSKSEIAGFV